MHPLIRVLPLLAVVPLNSGCVIAVREVAVARHKSSTLAEVRRSFPPGTSMEAVRTTMAERNYACSQTTQGTKMELRCDPTQRSGALFKGNWRLSFISSDGRLETISGSRAPKPPKAGVGNVQAAEQISDAT